MSKDIEKKLLLKSEQVIKRIFARVSLTSPYYEMLRELQNEIIQYNNREQKIHEMREYGFTIRQIAKALGYRHPGSISHLINKSNAIKK